MVGLTVWQTSPDVGELLDSETVPAKPFRAVTVMVDTAEEPTADTGEVAAIVTSTKLKAAVVV